MNHKRLPNGMVTRTELRRWYQAKYNYCPSWYTITAAIQQGMPCEPHPFLPGRVLFDLQACKAWIEARHASVQQKPSKKAVTP
jgi:hypothetical protein